MATNILRFPMVRGCFKAAWRTLKKFILGICDLDHLFLPYIHVHQYPLPSILYRTAGHINYIKGLCSSHPWRCNQDVSTSFNSISWNKDFVLPSLLTQTFGARSDIYKLPWLFPDFAKFRDPFKNSMTFPWLLIRLKFPRLFPWPWTPWQRTSFLLVPVQTLRKLFDFYWTEEGFWPNFVDFKHNYIQEFYRSYSFFLSANVPEQ